MALREGIRLLDVQAQQLSVKAELILVTDRNSSKQKRTVVWSPMVLGVSGQEMSIKTEIANGAGGTWSSGINSLKIKPRVNGDSTITLDADWTADVTINIDGQARPFHISHNASGTVRSNSGDTTVLTGAVVKLGDKSFDAELLLFLTPTIRTQNTPADLKR